jgi:cobalt/nickel transport system permease protein
MLMFGEFIVTGGMISFLSIMIKTVLSVWAVLLLVSTTGVADLSRQLSAIGVPNIMVLQFVMTYRYLSVLIKEARTMFASYILRSNGAKGIHMRDMGTFLGVLLLHSIDRADRVYSAMKCRGFSGSYPTPAREKIGFRDIFCLSAVCALVILFRCLS